MHPANPAGLWIPLVIVVVAMLLRSRRVGRERRFSPRWNLAVPALLAVVVAVALIAHPPAPVGWGGFVVGVVLGAPLGGQRARLTHIGHDPATGALTIRHSAGAMLLLVVVVVARQAARAWLIEAGAQGAWVDAVGLALLGLAVASIVAFRGELAWRARRLLASAAG